MGLRYGLLAALTLILASALVWDRMHPPETNRLDPREEPAREDVAVVVVGGTPVPLAPPPPPGASLPGVELPVEGASGAADPASTSPSGEGLYTVEKGDSLGLIAQKTLGTMRKAPEIARFNGMALDAPLKVGQELKIPPQVAAALAGSAPPGNAAPGIAPGIAPGNAPGAAPAVRAAAAPAKVPRDAPARRTHKVGKGDGLYALAKRYYGDGSKFRAIAEANGLDPDAPLKVGTELRIP